MPRRRPPPWSQRRLARLPAGVQPEFDGWLVCLMCGSRYRSLGRHLNRAHRLDARQYRQGHQLPATQPLMATDLRRRAARRARAQYPTNDGLHRGLDPSARSRAVRAAQRARRESAQRVGTQRALAQQMATRSEQVRRRTRQGYDRMARRLGSADIDALLHHTANLTDRALGLLLQVSASTAGRIRHLYGHPSWPAAVDRRAEQIRRGTSRKYNERAKAAGYRSLATLLAATRRRPDRIVADLLGCSVSTANRLRHNPPTSPGVSRR